MIECLVPPKQTPPSFGSHGPKVKRRARKALEIPRMSLKKIVLVLVVLLLVGAGLHYWRASKADRAHASDADAPVPVTVAQAARGDIELSLSVVGRVEAWSTVTLRARVSGQLQSLDFKPGSLVHKGALLAQIDPRLLRAQLDQAKGGVARDQAQLQKATADNRRYTNMLGKGYVSKADYDLYKANLAVARATLQSDRAAEELARTQLDYARITAPFDGVVGAPLVYPGAQISADSTDIAVVNQIEPIRVTFSIPEDSLPAVREAMADGPVKVKVTVAGDHAAPLAGELQFIDNAVDPSTGTIVLKARFDNAHHRLTPGQFVQVKLPTTRLKNVVSMPVEALQSSTGGSFVFVVGPDGKVHQRPVTPGPSTQGRTVIDEGLAGGERVVIEGQMLLVDGTSVVVQRD